MSRIPQQGAWGSIADMINAALVRSGTAATQVMDSVASSTALPTAGNTAGDVRLTEDTDHLWLWDGTAWVDGGPVGVPGQDGSDATVTDTNVAAALSDNSRAVVEPWIDARTGNGARPVGRGELVVNVKDYGAKGDGTTDDTAALIAAIAATRAGTFAGVSGGDVLLPPGEYRITSTIDLYRFAGTLRGAGQGNSPTYTTNSGSATVIKWAGAAGQPMILVRDSMHVAISDLRLEGNDAAIPSYAIESRWLAADGVGTNANLAVERVHIGVWTWSPAGLNTGKVDRGIGFTGDEGNNDQFLISNVTIMSAVTTGIYLANTQSIWGLLSHVAVLSAGIGIETKAGLTGVNLQFDNCGIDLKTTGTTAVSVFGWWSERSHLIYQGTWVGGLNVIGGKWQLTAISGANFFDHQLLTYGQAVNLSGVDIESVQSPHPNLRAVGAGGAPGGSRLAVVGCKTSMVLADYDVSNPSNEDGMTVVIDSGPVNVRRRLMNGQALGTTETVDLPAQIKVGGIFLRDNAGALEKSTDGTTWTAV